MGEARRKALAARRGSGDEPAEPLIVDTLGGRKRDVLGTLMLGLLAGPRRYAHITALRGDAVAAQALGMNKVVSEDALRRALERIDEAASAAWLRPSLMHSVREALDRPWVLDIDASIKPLYSARRAPRLATTRARPCGPATCCTPSW